MSRTGPRQTYFVCVSLSENNELITKVIPATSHDEAGKIFLEQVSNKPKEILGPFFKKRKQILESTRTLKFTNKTQMAIYNDWTVNAFYLKEPEDHAYLVFLKRTDGKNIPIPKGTIIVPISDLRSI